MNEGKLINVVTYNLQRLGDLAPKAERATLRQTRIECLKKEIKHSGQILGAPIELFAFQEVNNHNLNLLENELNLTCQHIGYHSQSRRLGGLGVCVKRGGGLKINYVRNISLKGEGHWRALFAEVSFNGDKSSTFNLLNVHFLPHGVGTRSVKSALLSPKSSYGLLRSIIKTSRKQREQAEGLLTLIKDYRDPTLLVGDFNAPPHGGAHPLLRAKWSDVWRASGTNFGATKYFGGIIPFRIDFIYALKDAFDMIESRVSEAQCSDHNAVSATLKIK